ncbi:MAG: WG repeat-containing protein [Muribaculaceae bacterium]|nr:WG repeat-containing protein [Muribaculaceae bacterium]
MATSITKCIRSAAVLALATLILAGCERKIPDGRPHPSDMPVKIIGQEKWSFFTNDGFIIHEDMQSGIPSLVINSLYSVKNEDNTFSLYNIGKGTTPELIAEGLKCVGWNNDNLIPASRRNSRIFVMGADGKKAFDVNPVDNTEIMETSLAFSDGLLMIITTDGKYGYIDTKGNVRIRPKYYAASNFSEGKAMVEIPGERIGDHRLYRFIDTQGNTVFNIPDSIRLETFRYVCGRVVARTASGRQGFLDHKGVFNFAISSADGIGTYDERYYVYLDNGAWGVASFKGKIIVKPEYLNVELLPDQAFLVQDMKGNYKVLDRNGIEKLDFTEYSYVKYVNGFGFICKIPEGTVLLNKNGKPVVDKTLSDVRLNRSASIAIRSDWYNPSNVYSQVADKITSFGVGKFKIGMPMYVFVRNEPSKDYTMRRFIRPDIFTGDSLVKFETAVYTTSPIAVAKAENSKGIRYEFNKNNRVNMIQIDMQLKHDGWRSAQLEFANSMRSKGYALVNTMESDGISKRYYKGMENVLIVIYDEHKKHVRIMLLDAAMAAPYRKTLFGD